MTDDINLQEIADNPSTVIDTGSTGVKSGGGKVAPETTGAPKTEARKPESARDSLEAEFKKLSEKPSTGDDNEGEDDNQASEDPKAKAEEDKTKEEKTTEPKPVKAEGEAASEASKSPKPSEGRKIIEAPARFLPRAKELWQNVPHPVREEFDRVMKENETEITRYREAHTFREELKEYDELARSHGTTVKQSLDNYVAIERKFAEDPAQGFRQLMSNLGMNPPQAISHILRAYGVTPQQLAAHLQQSPNEYTALAPQRPQQMPQAQHQAAPQTDPRVQQLEERLAQMEAERVANSVIVPFAQDHPEYYQYETEIAEVLKSGIIEKLHGTGLSPRDKLEVALQMVAPSASKKAVTVQDDDADTDTPAVDLRGGKSVRSSPGTVTNVSEPAKKMPVRDMLEEELRKLQRRA